MTTPESRLGFQVRPTNTADEGSLMWLDGTQPQSVRPATAAEVRMWNMIKYLWPVEETDDNE